MALQLGDARVPPLLWLVLVGLGVWYVAAWPRPDLVTRISGGSDPREGLRMLSGNSMP